MKKFLWEKGKFYFLVSLFMVLAFSPTFAQTVRKYAVVKVSTANIRSAPSKNGSILYAASKGEKLELVEDLGTWLRVRTKTGTMGFIYSPSAQVEIEKVVAPVGQPASQQSPPATSIQPPTVPPSGVQVKLLQRSWTTPLYIASLAAAGIAAYILFRKGGLLNRGTATLRVNSTPSEAKVYIDGDEKCETPCSVEGVEPGRHTIKVERELYGKWEQEMDLVGYQEYDINAELAPYGYEADFCFGGPGKEDGKFSWPVDLTIDDRGIIYVTDESKHCLQTFTSTGNFVSRVDTIPPYGAPLEPYGIVYSPTNTRIYVVFYNDSSLYWYHLSLVQISSRWLGLAMGGARYLGVDSSGNIYIADNVYGEIVKTDADGNKITEWSTGYTSSPMEAAPYEDNIYVSLWYYGKVKIYSPSGTEKGEFSQTISGPSGVTVDKMGHVYVVSRGWNKVYKFMPDGTEILHFGSYGSGNENLSYPGGIEVLENGDVLVVDTGNRRICKWRMSEDTISTARAIITVKRKKTGRFYDGRRKFRAGAGAPLKSIKSRRIRK